MSARQKNKHKSRHRTHAIKPASLSKISLAKRAPVAEEAPSPVAAPAAATAPKAKKPKAAAESASS
jgi:hypothetical protein